MTVPGTGLAFAGYHNRTSSRFGGYVDISIDGDRVTITGRRVSRAARGAWITAQAVVMVAAIGLMAYALIVGGRTAWLWLLAAFVVEWIGSSLGALFIWWPADLGKMGFIWMLAGDRKTWAEETAQRTYTRLELSRSAISDVARTNWYSRHGLWLVSWPWQLVALLGAGTQIVFDADDPDRPGRPLVFALNTESSDAAKGLVRTLSGNAETT